MRLLRQIFIIIFFFITGMKAGQKSVDWAIVGAGPAGIAVVGVLLDNGVPAQRIAWLDAEFNVGRLGKYYQNVPGNAKTKLYMDFILSCAAFEGCWCPCFDALAEYDQEEECPLELIIKPLKVVTKHLCKQVHAVQDKMISLYFDHDVWKVGTLGHDKITAKHVVLATGSRPKELPYGAEKIIPLDLALDPPTLHSLVTKEDVVGVVGSAHSAALVLKFTYESIVKKIYHFYKQPFKFPIDMGGWNLHGGTGLKGVAARWVKNVLLAGKAPTIEQVKSTQKNLQTFIPECSRMIYAIGYERDTLPAINDEQPITEYDAANGFIAPRLFGVGLAFPEMYTNPGGQTYPSVGLDAFMDYAQRMVPEWIAMYPDKREYVQRIRSQYKKLLQFKELFEISVL